MKVDPNKLQQIQELMNSGNIFEAQLILDELLNSDEICQCECCDKLIDKKTAVYKMFCETCTRVFCCFECEQKFIDGLYDYDGIYRDRR